MTKDLRSMYCRRKILKQSITLMEGRNIRKKEGIRRETKEMEQLQEHENGQKIIKSLKGMYCRKKISLKQSVRVMESEECKKLGRNKTRREKNDGRVPRALRRKKNDIL